MLFAKNKDTDQSALLGSLISDFIVYYPDTCTVKPVLSCHSKIYKTKLLMTSGSLMKVESIAECSLWSILQYF